MFPGLGLCYTDAAQHVITAAYGLGVDRDVSNLSVRPVNSHVCRAEYVLHCFQYVNGFLVINAEVEPVFLAALLLQAAGLSDGLHNFLSVVPMQKYATLFPGVLSP